MAERADIIKKLVKQRGTQKSMVTRFQTYVNDISTTPTEELQTQMVHELEARLEKLNSTYDEFYRLHNELIAYEAVKDDDKEDEIFDKAFFTASGQARAIISKSPRPISASVPAVSGAQNQAIGHQMHLPKIDIAKFGGGYDSWVEFRDTYSLLIHANTSLSSIQKYHYLRSALVGDAALVIKSLEVSANTYGEAWTLLCERYNNTRSLVNTHIQGLLDLPAIGKESSSKLNRFADNIGKHVRTLTTLKQPTEHWDAILIYLMESKLDTISVREWETDTQSNSNPTMDEFLKFLRKRATIIETIENKREIKPSSSRDSAYTQFKGRTNSFYAASDNIPKCSFCGDKHYPNTCPRFNAMKADKRRETVKSLKLCFNCLRRGHTVQVCRSSTCKICQRKHNTLLHPSNDFGNRSEVAVSRSEQMQAMQPEPQSVVAVANASAATNYNALLPTATVLVKGKDNREHKARVLLDSGSQSNFVTSEFIARLGVKARPNSTKLSCLGNSQSHITGSCNLSVQSSDCKFKASIFCFVLPVITSPLPNETSDFEIPKNIHLSDENYNITSPIDMLLGAELFWELLRPEQIRGRRDQPILQNTQLGWIISGRLPKPTSHSPVVGVATLDVQDQLARFWELECVSSDKAMSRDENHCEVLFQKTVTRKSDGRFVVEMPLRDSPTRLGDSLEHAKRRFFSLEHKLARNEARYGEYRKFMNEYIALGHMSPTNTLNRSEYSTEYYIPHHAVINDHSSTTKLRVVFDASAKTSSGVSLNDIQIVGPTLQDDLWSILIRFRIYNYVISADITKMYRQIEMAPSHRPLQKILWRNANGEPIQHFYLNTITYGTAAASYQAIRCLFELAKQVESSNPELARIIRYSFYVDNLLTGAPTIAKAIEICKDVKTLLDSACMPLHSWASNSTDVINSITSTSLEKTHDFGVNEQSRTLGLLWSPAMDKLSYKTDLKGADRTPTKRVLLSIISQIFDPLGLLGPVTITAKIILQKLWLLKLEWDDEIPETVLKNWSEFYNHLDSLLELRIPRQAVLHGYNRIELHGFSDASESAYGACVYLRTTDGKQIRTCLLTAKSRVAPLKTQTIPRLELCAAYLLSALITKVIKMLHLTFNAVFLWTDSTVVLGWLKTNPSTLKAFVSHRVASIQTETEKYTWGHVSTHDNPADVLSRGVSPSQIINNSCWWNGPDWLLLSEEDWPSYIPKITDLPEIKSISLAAVRTLNIKLIDIEKYSSLTKLERIIAYVIRFTHNVRHPPNKRTGCLQAHELSNALDVLIKMSQEETFREELRAINNNKPVKTNSQIAKMHPFVDEGGILRVGGRLSNSNYSYSKKHPALLCHKHILTKLLVKQTHERHLHVGAQQLLSILREKHWILAGRNLIRNIVHKCVKCFRAKPRFVQPLMGDLPEARITPNPPFLNCGVDYAGPIYLKTRNARGCKLFKAYICIFVCLSVKAVHLEVVSSLTADAFIATLRRFVARRGLPQNIHSDNGTNFVGARSELKELYDFLKRETDEISNFAANEQFAWHFIPARAPNFGGIWEAGVRAVKNHLKRVIGETKLTFEDFQTLLTQIEAVLNSRPLSPVSSDPNDLIPLTPAHFLVGRPLIAVADPDVCSIAETRLSTFQRIQAMVQHFWRRWSREYIHQLQTRPKWQRDNSLITAQEGSLVLIAEDHRPPTMWRMGRITHLHAGKDGIVRVVSIRTQTGQIERPVSKICILPHDQCA